MDHKDCNRMVKHKLWEWYRYAKEYIKQVPKCESCGKVL